MCEWAIAIISWTLIIVAFILFWGRKPGHPKPVESKEKASEQ